MIKYLLLLPLFCNTLLLQAQTDTVTSKINKIPHKRVDAIAKFLQGDFKNYITTKLQTNHTVAYSIKGQIILVMTINADGSVSHVSVLKSLSPQIDPEVVQVIKTSPKWQPATLNAQNVSMDMVLNIDLAVNGVTPATVKPKPVLVTNVNLPPINKPAPLTVKKATPPAIAKAKPPLPQKAPLIALKKPTVPPVKKPVPAPVKKVTTPVVKKATPPVVKKTEPPAAKKTLIAKAPAVPVVKKTPPPVIKKPQPPLVKKPIAPIAKKVEPPIAKKPPVIAKKVEPPVAKKLPVVAKKVEPPIAKKPEVKPAAKEPILAKKAEPVVVKKKKRVVAKMDLFHPSSHNAEFPGGLSAFLRYLSENITYPPDSKKANVQGKVFITFTVEEDGSVNDVEAVSSPAEDLSQEAIRVLLASPRWKPASQNGRNVPVSYTIPINFTLADKTTN
ncbi:TonB family protein [Mucilaginibacter gracilis]|uniref:TonB family protein n=1 Tax=Mucilaginibacter gracilis TaxID=423350 RepID=A0A495J3P6_9SPHI|nr:energy transducer TonB [Mucilaginibacter gracilis]RKR83605.1 TonB family protein [Mucilaginibacter gracilis]